MVNFGHLTMVCLENRNLLQFIDSWSTDGCLNTEIALSTIPALCRSVRFCLAYCSTIDLFLLYTLLFASPARECLWKFFFPPDYQTLKVSEIAQPGKPRQIQAFELRMNIIANATIDLLFTKNKVSMPHKSSKLCTRKTHSYLEIYCM